MTIYGQMKTAISEILPSGWVFIDHEPQIDPLPDKTAVTLRVRTVARLPEAPLGGYRVTWVITVTSGLTQRQSADQNLFDDLIEFLNALDESDSLSWLGWTDAVKGNLDDEKQRLVYDINVTHTTQKET